MFIILLGIATVLLITWLVLLFMASPEDWIAAAYNKVFDHRTMIHELRIKDTANQKKLAAYHGITAVFMKFFLTTDSGKEIEKLEIRSRELQSGNLKKLAVFDIPGYVLLRKVDGIGKGNIHKKIYEQCYELYGKKHAANKTRQLLARLLSYSLGGVALSLVFGTLVMGTGNLTAALLILGVGTLLILVLVYALYDDVSDKVNKRREEISRQFPNVVSKLALLVTSGMIMERAWKETAFGQELVLYKEMQRTSEELDNLVSPEAAYGAFIKRCNTKETTKLSSAIMQNLSKGNAEIGTLLRSMAHEAWMERRHTAKRDSEKANSKLMVPTMLLLFAILIMIMVPVALSFSGF